MANINSLYLLVHPGYEAIKGANPIVKLHPEQQRLESKWDELVTSLTDRQETALLYVSPLRTAEYQVDIPFPTDPIAHHLHKDHVRRSRYKAMLGNRFVQLPNENFTTDNVAAALSTGELSLDADALTLQAFGEYTSICVNTWSERLANILHIPHYRRQLRVDLSLSKWTTEDFADWRKMHINFAERANKERR